MLGVLFDNDAWCSKQWLLVHELCRMPRAAANVPPCWTLLNASSNELQSMMQTTIHATVCQAGALKRSEMDIQQYSHLTAKITNVMHAN